MYIYIYVCIYVYTYVRHDSPHVHIYVISGCGHRGGTDKRIFNEITPYVINGFEAGMLTPILGDRCMLGVYNNVRYM